MVRGMRWSLKADESEVSKHFAETGVLFIVVVFAVVVVSVYAFLLKHFSKYFILEENKSQEANL